MKSALDEFGRTMAINFISGVDDAVDRNIHGIGDEYYNLQGYQNKIDASVGGGVGGLLGASAGYYAGGLFDEPGSSVKQKVVNRLVGTGTGLATGGIVGAGTGIVAGRTDLINKLYTKLSAKLKNNKWLTIRDLLGRTTSFIQSRKEPWDNRIKRLDHLYQGFNDNPEMVQEFMMIEAGKTK